MRSRLAAVVVLAMLVAPMLVSTGAHARVRQAPDLPPADREALARMFDPQLEPLGLRTTRAALQTPGSYERSDTGTHLAVYVEPIGEGEIDRAVYVRNIMKTARIFLPFVYNRWSDLKTFDVCQEPEPVLDPRQAPVPVTQLIADRKGAAAVKWERASLATLLKKADEINGKRNVADPLSLFVSPRAYSEPAYQEALRRAGIDRTAPPSS
jgi:hypothetical protein